MSDVVVPRNVQDLLSLGENFSNTNFFSKKAQSFEMLIEVGRNIYKIPLECREEIGQKFVNQTNNFLSNIIKDIQQGKYILNFYNETRSFLKLNPSLIVIQPDKSHCTVFIEKKQCQHN